jgi:hypothetical protein
MKPWLPLLLLLGLGCASSPPAPGIWRPKPGEPQDRIPGPINLKNFGPFDSFSRALDATCSLILSLPNASVGHLQDPQLALRASAEYCAWLYYTPAGTYELSMLSDLSEPGDHLHGKASCLLPWLVDDPRYAPDKLKYVFYVHNHPLAGELSDRDIFLASEMANLHGLVVETKQGKVPVALIAFFSHSEEGEQPTCDGAYQYIPATAELLQWSRQGRAWSRERIGTVVWTRPTKFHINRE